jgi:DNA-directed RNA polymerase specialized sigma24 family protein
MEYTNSQIRTLIEEHVHSIRDRELLFLRFIDGLTYDQIANQYQRNHPENYISVDTVKRAIRKSESKLFAHLPMP